jgi:carbon starvation protein CstA
MEGTDNILLHACLLLIIICRYFTTGDNLMKAVRYLLQKFYKSNREADIPEEVLSG